MDILGTSFVERSSAFGGYFCMECLYKGTFIERFVLHWRIHCSFIITLQINTTGPLPSPFFQYQFELRTS